MRIQVRLFASLRKGRFDSPILDCPEDASVSDVLKLLQIPEAEASIIFINGRITDTQATLRCHDRLAIFPPIGGG